MKKNNAEQKSDTTKAGKTIDTSIVCIAVAVTVIISIVCIAFSDTVSVWLSSIFNYLTNKLGFTFIWFGGSGHCILPVYCFQQIWEDSPGGRYRPS